MTSQILRWSEVWATFLPILVWLYKKPSEPFIVPVINYLWLALLLYFICDLGDFDKTADNHSLYNAISVIRLFLFMQFFALLGIPSTKKLQLILFSIVTIFIAFNFIYNNPFKVFSSTFTLEASILITYCILYFFKKLRSDEESTKFDPSLIIVTGLAVYEAVSFPIFLSYDTLTEKTRDFAVDIWDVHNIAYIVFCLFIARAFYGRVKL